VQGQDYYAKNVGHEIVDWSGLGIKEEAARLMSYHSFINLASTATTDYQPETIDSDLRPTETQ